MKTLAEILDEKCQESKPLMLSNRKIIELMQFVREETLKECAKKATTVLQSGSKKITNSEVMYVVNDVVVNQHSILSLDKNSLDV